MSKLIEGSPVSAADFASATSPENNQLMGVKPLRMYLAGKPEKGERLARVMVEGLIEGVRNYTGSEGVLLDTPDGANAILFPMTHDKQINGLFGYKREYNGGQGAGGIAITTIPEDREDMVQVGREILSRSASQYAFIGVGSSDSTKAEKMYVISMEGGRPAIEVGEEGMDGAFKEAGQRLTRLAGGIHATERVRDKSLSRRTYNKELATEVAGSGRVLAELGLLRHVSIKDYTDSLIREKQIALFVGTGGMSEGNMSAFENDLLIVTGSGLNKIEMDESGIGVVGGIKPDLTGMYYEGKKPSVETVDAWFIYAAAAGIKAGAIQSSDLSTFKSFMSDQEAVKNVLTEQNTWYQSMTHIHRWIDSETVDESKYKVVDVNPKHVPDKAFHSSCGTIPLALYTAEPAIRAMFEERDNPDPRTIIVLLPNHGLQMIYPKRLPEALRDLRDAMGSGMKFPVQIPPR